MLLTLEEIKLQCRLESDFTAEDQLLELFALAAEAKAVTYLNRNLYKTIADIAPLDTDGIVITEDIRLALLMLVSHWYEHRSSVSELEMTETPQAFEFLLYSRRLPVSGY
ncbi:MULTISPECIES: head-tail connector protein [Pantoea]|uniref:Phage gp6-like head-tail connector family protein n=2 Tax=Pantoea TaxID=53335 RepID=A0A0U3KSV3_9GAMM|nr:MULTISPECIES: head-tail connector protein [Pantoea]ALV91547.1 phage gp6-like head-tail connector family protein [Pantoea vagans]KHJ65756.1 phage gp6-like head-tail connector family protein [Pantoea rodasii]